MTIFIDVIFFSRSTQSQVAFAGLVRVLLSGPYIALSRRPPVLVAWHAAH